MNHTSTPYEVEEVISINLFGDKSENYAIVQKESRDRIALLGQNKKKNAEFIVTACNAHEDLVRDLRSANDFIQRAMQILTPDQIGFCGFYRPKEKAGVKL